MGESFSVPTERIKFLQAKLKELIAIKPEDIDTIFTLDSKGLQQYFDAIAQEQAKLEKGKGTKKTSNKEKDTSYQAQIAELDKFYQEKLAKAKEYGQSSLAVEKEYQEKRLALIEQFIKEEDKKKGAGKGIGVETKSAATNEKGSGVTLGDELTKTKLMSDAFGRYQAQQKELQAELKKTQEEIIATHDKIAKTKALLEAAKKNNTSGREIKTLNQDLQAMQAYFQQLEEKAQNIRVEINEAELSFSNIKSGLNDIEKIGKSKLQIQLINIEEERKRLLKIIEENRRAKIAAAKDNAEEIARIEADAKKQQNTVNKDADRQQQDAKAAAANAYVQGGIGIAKSLTKVIADSIEQGGLDGFAALQASSEILDQIGNMVGDATAQAVIKSVAAAIEITGMILKAVSAANVKAFEKEVQTIVDSTKKNADEAAQKIVDDIHKSIVDQSQAPMKEAATSLLQAITNGFQSGDFTNFSKSIDDIIKKLVVEKMVMFSGLQGAIEKLVNNMFSGFKGSGAQQINALKQEQEPLKQEMEATKKEYDAYQKLVRLRDEGIRQQSLWYHQRTGHYAGLWEKDVKKEVTKLNGEIAKLEGSAARYKAAQEKLANLNEQIKAINPNEKADLTQIKKMDKDELKRLAEEYGEPIKELFKMLGVDTGEGFQKALTDSMSSALTSSLGDAAYNADWGSFKKSFAAEMKKAIIQSAMQSAGIKAKVDSLIQGILADGKVTSEEVNGTINALKPLYDRLEKMMAEIAETTKALEGGVEVKAKTSGSIIQQLSGADRDVLLEAIKNGFSTINQSIDLKDATIQHLAATQIIINAVTFNSYNGTVNIYADKAISLQDLVQEITKEMIARG